MLGGLDAIQTRTLNYGMAESGLSYSDAIEKCYRTVSHSCDVLDFICYICTVLIWTYFQMFSLSRHLKAKHYWPLRSKPIYVYYTSVLS